MSPNPVAAAAAWTAAVTVDVAATVLAALALGWQQHCPAGTWACPATADRAGDGAVVLLALAAALVVVALLALMRGRLVIVATQVALVVALAALAQQAVPAPFHQLRTMVGAGAPGR